MTKQPSSVDSGSVDSTSTEQEGVEKELSALLSSATLVFLGGLVASGAKLAERVLLGRVLSPTLYGEVNMGLAILTLGTTLSIAGFSQGIPRYLSRVDNNRERRGVWASGVLVTGVLALVIAGVLTLQKNRIASLFFETDAAPQLLQLFVLALPLVVGFKIAMAGIRGCENTIYKTYVGDLLYPGGRILLLWLLLSIGYGIFAAGYAYLALAAVAFVLAHFLFNRLVPLIGPFETRIGEMTRFSAPLVVSTLLSVLLTQADTMMLGFFKSSAEVGIYSAAYPLATGMLIVLSSFGFLYLPLTSRLDADGRRGEIDTIYAMTTKWIFIVTFPAFLLFTVFASDTITIFFKEEYANGGLALAILAVGFFTNAVAGRTRETISAFGATKVIMVANGATFGLNILLNLVLIPEFSFVGAAVASAIANISLNVGLLVVLSRRFGITPLSAWSRRTFVLLPLALFPPALLLSQWVDMTLLWMPVFLVVTGLSCLAVAATTGCLQKEDEIVVTQIENVTGVELSWFRKYIPSEADE